MDIRKITIADKPELLKIMTEFYNSPALLHHTPAEVLSRVIDDCISDMPYIDGYAAISDDKIIGYTMLSVGYSTEYGGISVMIEDLCVIPEMRGNGIGKSLLDFVCERSKSKAARIRLEVAPDNVGASKLYTRCGFSDINYRQMGKIFDRDF